MKRSFFLFFFISNIYSADKSIVQNQNVVKKATAYGSLRPRINRRREFIKYPAIQSVSYIDKSTIPSFAVKHDVLTNGLLVGRIDYSLDSKCIIHDYGMMTLCLYAEHSMTKKIKDVRSSYLAGHIVDAYEDILLFERGVPPSFKDQVDEQYELIKNLPENQIKAFMNSRNIKDENLFRVVYAYLKPEKIKDTIYPQRYIEKYSRRGF